MGASQKLKKCSTFADFGIILFAFSFRLTINALAQKLNAYWKEKTSQENFETSVIARPIP